MISASQDLKDIFYESRTVNISAGCTIEYNMNSLLDNTTISTTITDQNYIDSVTEQDGQIIRINPFKKLFPLDSVLKPFRPTLPGVKHYINIDADHQGSNRFYDYRTLPYPSTAPRVYYPGTTNYYKYWITPQNTGVNATVKYVQSTATISEAYATGEKVVYTTTADHGFTIGKTVSISGSGTASWNLTSQVITEVTGSRKFTVANTLAQASESGLSKTATLSSPTKPALANKIVIRFEKYHALPATCSIVVTYNDDTTASPSAFAVPSNGTLNIYWNGSSWSTNPPFSSSQAISYPAPKEIKSIAVSTPSAGAGLVIGVTEISARWVKDISSDIISFDITKESTSSPQDILPVGNITANSLSLSLAKYDQSNLKVLTYNRDDNWTVSPVPNDVIYFAKNAEIRPHLKVFHSLGAVTEGSLKYDRIEQGSYYLDAHSISQFGDVQVEALDGSKQLMEALIPDLIYEDAPATSIIMSILDSIGFTNYNINILLNESDENNVLQFYSRDYLYSRTNVDWEFYYAQNGDNLPNIIDFSKQEVASANQVKVIWRTPMSSLYKQTAVDLWASEPSFLISGGLRYDIQADTPAELVEFNIDIDNLDPLTSIESTFNYSGYFLVDSEVFEYDAIEFEYEPLDSATKQVVFVGSESDWAQYRALSKTGPQYFKPTGKYRIKARGVFGTAPSYHKATGTGTLTAWTQIIEDQWN